MLNPKEFCDRFNDLTLEQQTEVTALFDCFQRQEAYPQQVSSALPSNTDTVDKTTSQGCPPRLE